MWLFFAGGEAWCDLLLDMGVKNQLFSYFYFRTSLRTNGRKARETLARMRVAKSKGYRFMLDSGAFTYQVKMQQGVSLGSPKKYFEEYKRFIQDNGDLFDIIVEFDIDGYVKDEQGKAISTRDVDAWTNELMKLDVGSKIMPVFHEHRGTLWYRDWLVETASPLVGLGSAAAAVGAGGAAKLIALAHRFGKFVHGFAQTRIRTDIKYTPYDSVDSTTWLRADKYGGTCIFRNGKFIVLDHKHKKDRAMYKAYFEGWGLDFKKVMADDLQTMRLATIIAWRELANEFEKRWYYRTGGKHPYLYEMYKANGELPYEHPLVTRARTAADKAPGKDLARSD